LLWLALGTVASLAVSACAPSVDVAAEERSQIRTDEAGTTQPESSEPNPPPSPQVPSDDPNAPAPDLSSLAWGSCDAFGIPSVELLGTSRWECSTLDVSMDPFNERTDLGPVTLALTRHRATGERRGALVLNPGGPGGTGLDAAWGIRPGLPADVLRAYDVVSWDPRGVGRSTPPINCGDDPNPDDIDFMQACVTGTGDLAGFLAAPYSAADLEAVRVALGEERLDYLGYSYGTTIGAAYAARYPDRVGHFVLDGATNPLIGGPDGTFDGGFPYYADDGFDAARDRFVELCDQTEACPMGGDTAAALDELRNSVANLPTDAFQGEPEIVDDVVFDGVFQAALTYAGDWPLLATAFGDARNGDASALAALSADLSVDDPASAGDDEANASAGPSFEIANIVIYCADFADLIEGFDFCAPLPRNEYAVEPVAAVDVDRTILVIGTEYDPLTPGYHAAEFAAALGDAVHVIWDGVGHTAFPRSSRCIDDIVTDQLLDGPLPDDGQRCAFVDGAADDAEAADLLFTHDRGSAVNWITGVLIERGGDVEQSSCIGSEIVRTDDRTISHVILDVQSTEATDALTAARAVC
jgi:pimeloyl-ACP methyl ester carboxylesterase